MDYIAVFALKNKDRAVVELFECDNDDGARDCVKQMKEALKSQDQQIVIGTELYAIDHIVST